ADPGGRAIIASIGGDDQIRVVPHLDADLLRADPKPFLGHSDNTNILNWMWTSGPVGLDGRSTQAHLGLGPGSCSHRARHGQPLHTMRPCCSWRPRSRIV
ncbi:MAG: LD-carboxypeptidase, partial [Propionibacterium sp.]|nr:LD-carboxypeptidase [Propionibacterium sp.]